MESLFILIWKTWQKWSIIHHLFGTARRNRCIVCVLAIEIPLLRSAEAFNVSGKKKERNGWVHNTAAWVSAYVCMSASTCIHTQMHVHTFPNPIYLTTQITEFFHMCLNSIHYWILLYYKNYPPPPTKTKNHQSQTVSLYTCKESFQKKKTVTVCVSDF